MLHKLYWRGLGPALRVLGPDVTLPASVMAARAASRLKRWPGIAQGVRLGFPDAGEDFVQDVVRGDARRRFRTALDRLVIPTMDRAALERLVDVEGVEHLLAGPAIVVQAHFGVHGLPGVGLALCGVPLTVHAVMIPDDQLPPGRGYSQAQRRELEQRLGVIQYVHAPGREGLAQCRAVLERGEVLLGVPDGASSLELVPGEARELPALGRTLRWPRYAFDLATEVGVPICGLFPDSSGPRHRLEVVALDQDDPQADFVARYDAMLRRVPAQWQFWEHFRPGGLLV